MSRCALVTEAAGDLGRAAGVALAADGWSLLDGDRSSYLTGVNIEVSGGAL